MIYTIGHSNHSINTFIKLIQQVNVHFVIDMRAFTFSRYVPHFNQNSLAYHLDQASIKYKDMGQLLGPRIKEEKAPLHQGKVLYQEVLNRPRYQQGIEIIKQEYYNGVNIVLLSTCNNPLECHRFTVVSRLLTKQGIQVSHILKDDILTHHEVEKDMIKKTKNRIKRGTLTAPDINSEMEWQEFSYESTAQRQVIAGLKKYAHIKKSIRTDTSTIY